MPDPPPPAADLTDRIVAAAIAANVTRARRAPRRFGRRIWWAIAILGAAGAVTAAAANAGRFELARVLSWPQEVVRAAGWAPRHPRGPVFVRAERPPTPRPAAPALVPPLAAAQRPLAPLALDRGERVAPIGIARPQQRFAGAERIERPLRAFVRPHAAARFGDENRRAAAPLIARTDRAGTTPNSPPPPPVVLWWPNRAQPWRRMTMSTGPRRTTRCVSTMPTSTLAGRLIVTGARATTSLAATWPPTPALNAGRPTVATIPGRRTAPTDHGRRTAITRGQSRKAGSDGQTFARFTSSKRTRRAAAAAEHAQRKGPFSLPEKGPGARREGGGLVTQVVNLFADRVLLLVQRPLVGPGDVAVVEARHVAFLGADGVVLVGEAVRLGAR